MSALEHQLARRAARPTPTKARAHEGEVLSVTGNRAAVVIADAVHTVSTVPAPRAPVAGETVAVEFGAALPKVTGVMTPGGASGGIQAGQASFSLYTTGGTTVNFPTAFAAAPRVLLTLANTPASKSDVISLNVDDVTASGFYIYANCPGNFAGATAYVNWLAIPDTSA